VNYIVLLALMSTIIHAETDFDRRKYGGVIAIPSKIKKAEIECLDPAHSCGQKESCIFRYSSYSEIKPYKKEMLREIVQRMTDQVQGKGFKYLGEYKDFDHCHLLLGKNKKPFAALCHTQERAAEYPGTPFDYVDKSGRNWIVWLDGSGKIENAMKYRFDQKPVSWNSKVTFAEFESKYTVTPFMLDPKKLGHEQTEEDVEFIFTKTECPQASPNIIEDSNIIRVKLKNDSKICLALEDIPCHDKVSTCKAQCID
jgi:hypothetical protein